MHLFFLERLKTKRKSWCLWGHHHSIIPTTIAVGHLDFVAVKRLEQFQVKLVPVLWISTVQIGTRA